MKERHICPKCGLAVGWHGPSRLSKSKIRAFFFYLWHRSPCIVDCANCGHTISAKEWLKLKRIPRVDGVPIEGE